ncbi:MAG TPA: 2-succinyl-5-enolpyruvyl-6-hydroxy-3-cyclohexene-1-carboxylic-acid synthase [Robiginitalea sp.]|nr:2-succinyl-5-enolpyruvyl-6-hydroxy-3-cyclohexene-1-carboxylic-acid synthase [Robiginitalea sp.]
MESTGGLRIFAPDMKYTNIPLAHTVVALCKLHGIRQIVISPGSRNAPLVNGFTGDTFFECFSLVDERSAGFFALGLSLQSGQPAALVCTSGSAMLNYYPAVAEAYYSRIPLVVLSADRPPYKVDIGDGQTIWQEEVYGRHIGFAGNLRQDLTHATAKIRWTQGECAPAGAELEARQAECQAYNERLIRRAIGAAREERLPVHLNIPLEEPLYELQDRAPVDVQAGQASGVTPPPGEGESLSGAWEQAGRKMVLVGSMAPDAVPAEWLERLAADPSVLVFTETTSNLHHPRFFPSIDSLIAPLERSGNPNSGFEALRPDLLLTFGGMVVSKKIKQFLRRYPPKTHWHADPHYAYDTYYCLKRHIRKTPADFLADLLSGPVGQHASGYRQGWADAWAQCQQRRTAYLGQIPFSDFTAFHHIFQAIPAGYQIHLANSSTVRYAQLFEMRPENPVYCNRGTSGIEGSTSTAVGAAWHYDGPTLLISGDLGFMYDSNGLWNRYLRPDFRVVVIHNQGGGIFRILPGHEESPRFETYFETINEHSLQPLCDLHGLEYQRAGSEEGLQDALARFFGPSERPVLLEVRTPRELNDKILLNYFEYLTSFDPRPNK